jgi:hypothetical protein
MQFTYMQSLTCMTHLCHLPLPGAITDPAFTVHCWGATGIAQEDRTKMLNAPKGTRFDFISVGGLQSCGIMKKDGLPLCWGYILGGQAFVTRDAGALARALQDHPPLRDLPQSLTHSAGAYFTCGVDVRGSVRCTSALPEARIKSSSLRLCVHPFAASAARSFNEAASIQTMHIDSQLPTGFGENEFGQLNVPSGKVFTSLSTGGWSACNTNAWSRSSLGSPVHKAETRPKAPRPIL